MESAKKILIHEGKYFSWKKGDMHTQYGVVKEKDLKKAKTKVKSHKGTEFKIIIPNIIDLLKKAKRGPQIMVAKDIGLILTLTGIDKNSTVLDAGSGSGFLAINLARFVKKVVSYERRKDFLKIAQENAQYTGMKNISFKEQDVYEGIKEKKLDLIVLDLPEPERAVEHASKALKAGAHLVAYLPSIVQVQTFIKEAEKKFLTVKVVELLERDWHVEGRKVRPQSQMLGHTGFLCFVRKI